jgi:hypothetical protein
MDAQLRVDTLTVDCEDAAVVARFWCELLGYEVVPNSTDSIATAHPDGSGPTLLFTWAGTRKAGKNRIHLDLRPRDQRRAIERALELGARPTDVGQTGDESWVVLEDPEGNEFCILQSDDDLARWQTTAPGPEPSI